MKKLRPFGAADTAQPGGSGSSSWPPNKLLSPLSLAGRVSARCTRNYSNRTRDWGTPMTWIGDYGNKGSYKKLNSSTFKNILLEGKHDFPRIFLKKIEGKLAKHN